MQFLVVFLENFEKSYVGTPWRVVTAPYGESLICIISNGYTGTPTPNRLTDTTKNTLPQHQCRSIIKALKVLTSTHAIGWCSRPLTVRATGNDAKSLEVVAGMTVVRHLRVRVIWSSRWGACTILYDTRIATGNATCVVLKKSYI